MDIHDLNNTTEQNMVTDDEGDGNSVSSNKSSESNNSTSTNDSNQSSHITIGLNKNLEIYDGKYLRISGLFLISPKIHDSER